MDGEVQDPEQLALLYVQQYLEEQGYFEALASVEKQSGILYDSDKLNEGSQLMRLIWHQIEEQHTNQHDNLDRKFTEEEALLRGGRADYAKTLAWSITGLHRSNIISVKVLEDRDVVVTSSGDGFVRGIEFNGTLLWEAGVGSGAALSLAVSKCKPSLLAVGSMDGTLSLLDHGGKLLASCQPHKKYIVSVAWAADGEHLITASWDHSVGIHRCSHIGEPGMALETTRQVVFPSQVQDACFLQDGHTIVVALRDTNCLHLLDLQDAQVERKVNMNELHDNHVSFYAQRLALSPDGLYLLVATDKPRLILFRVEDWQQVRTFVGLPMEQFHQHCLAWHYDSHYFYIAAAGGQIYVYQVGTAKVVAKTAAHPGSNVRDLCYDAARHLLVSCSYDKTVKGFLANDEFT